MNKTHIRIHLLSAVMLATLVAGITTIGRVAAATSTLTLNPSASSVQSGNQVVVSLVTNPGTAIDTVDASVSYDAAKFTLVSVDCTGSALTPFPSCPTSGNPVHISAADLGGTISTQATVARLTFKATAASGTGTFGLTGDAVYQSNSVGPAVSGTSVTITAVAATCPAGQTGTPPNCTTPTTTGGGSTTTSGGGTKTTTTTPTSTSTSTSTKTTTTTTTTPATTTTATTTSSAAVTVSQPTVQFTSANMTTTSKQPTQVYLQYGLSDDALTQQTTPTDFATSHQIAVDSSKLDPGQTYYYVIVSKAQDGTTTQTEVQSFKTKGLNLSVGVFDKNHKPITGKKVTLHSSPVDAVTNDKGYAVFSDVTAGTHHVIYQEGSKTHDASVAVINNVTTDNGVEVAPTQNISVVYTDYAAKSYTALIRATIIALVVAVVGGVAFFFIRSRLKSALPGGAPLTANSVVVGGAPNYNNPNTAPTVAPQVVAPPQPSKLDTIPAPTQPSPGSTIAPKGDEGGSSSDDGKVQGGF